MNTYDLAASNSGDGVSWLDTLTGLAKTGADVYKTVSTNKASADIAKQTAPVQAAAYNNNAKMIAWAAVGLIVVVLGFVTFSAFRSKGK
jgi:hypothetical protein